MSAEGASGRRADRHPKKRMRVGIAYCLEVSARSTDCNKEGRFPKRTFVARIAGGWETAASWSAISSVSSHRFSAGV
jgi:hypothetical protein